MKTIALCGSMRFQEDMRRVAFDLEVRHGWNILQCAYNVDGLPLTDAMLARLDAAQKRRIELADAIYVVDIGGYVGEATRREMAYARSLGREIILHSEFSGR